MEQAGTSSRIAQATAWIHEIPCGDKTHANENPAVQSIARSICRLRKVIVARKVNGAYEDAPEHHRSVRPELVAAVNQRAAYLVQEQKQCETEKKYKVDGSQQAKQDTRPEKASVSVKEGHSEVTTDESKCGGPEMGDKAGGELNGWEVIHLEEDESANKKLAQEQSAIVDDWQLINKGDVAANEDYIFRQVQTAQVSKCVVQ